MVVLVTGLAANPLLTSPIRRSPIRRAPRSRRRTSWIGCTAAGRPPTDGVVVRLVAVNLDPPFPRRSVVGGRAWCER